MRTRGVVVAVVPSFGSLLSACNRSSPAAPAKPTLGPGARDNPASTLSGRVTATNGGHALSGLTVSLNGQTAVTGIDGEFVLGPVTTRRRC